MYYSDINTTNKNNVELPIGNKRELLLTLVTSECNRMVQSPKS